MSRKSDQTNRSNLEKKIDHNIIKKVKKTSERGKKSKLKNERKEKVLNGHKCED